MTDGFATLTDPFRGELLAYCYRMLGAVSDAEDAVQDTYLRAWRGYERFEGRSSLRRWLYAIATRVCLTALESRGRRPLPSGLGTVEPGQGETVWLEPLPDSMVVTTPETVVAARAGVRLALVAALQHLPARQRAVLILCDVLAWSAAEVATLLSTSVPSVNSALQRARERLRSLGLAADDVAEPADTAVLDRYAAAFTSADVEGLAILLRDDVVLEMPPQPIWYSGRDAVVGFLGSRVLAPGRFRLRATRANGQPAFVVHERSPSGEYVPHGLLVLTFAGGRIARITAFNDPALVALCA